MDIQDARVAVKHYTARLPGPIKPVMWGPLQMEELGLKGWEVQDAGETGMILHQRGVSAGEGRQWSTLIVVNRQRTAKLTTMIAGITGTDREIELWGKRATTACEVYLSRLAGVRIEFREDEPKTAAPAPVAPPVERAPSRSQIWEL